jgi:hypothetical protein
MERKRRKEMIVIGRYMHLSIVLVYASSGQPLPFLDYQIPAP